MSRWATHFLLLGTKAYKMHCLELDAAGNLQRYFPLTEEIAGTSFVAGILWLSSKQFPDYSSLITFFAGKALHTPGLGEKARLFQIRLHPLSASELSTDYSGSNCHIQ